MIPAEDLYETSALGFPVDFPIIMEFVTAAFVP